MSNDKATIFISYSADNLGIARVLAELTKAAGLSVWFDRWSLTPGDEWAAAHMDALSNATLAVILIGANADSPNFLAEVDALATRAKEKDALRLFPVLTPAAGPDIPHGLRHVDILDLREAENVADRIAIGIDAVKGAIGSLIEHFIDRPDLIAMIYATIGKQLYALDKRAEAMLLFDSAVAKIPEAVASKTPNNESGLFSGLFRSLVQLVQKSKPVHEESAKPPLQQLIAFLGNWASEMHDRGDHERARMAQQSLLDAIGDSDDPTALTLASNLALTLRAEGRLDDARQLEVRVLAKRVHIDNEHPDTLAAMSNLAATLQAQGDLAGALELQTSALAIRRHVLGEEHPDTLTAMNNLAETLRATGDLGGALELQKLVLATQHRVIGEEHPATLISMNNLASTLWAQGDLGGALELQKLVLATQRRIFGEEHPHTLASMNNLAGTLYAQGDMGGALELEKSALAIRRRVLGDAHPDTIVSAWNLLHTVVPMKDHAMVKELFESFLFPLLQADTSSLSADLQGIRQQLVEMFASAASSQEPQP